MIHNNPGAPLPRYIGPNPLNENAHAEAGRAKELKMDRRPRKPCQESAQAKFPALQNGEPLANHGHIPFVEIAEWKRCRRTRHARAYQPPRVPSWLYCYLRDAWQRLAVLIERCGVAHNQNLGMSRYRQVLLYPHPPSTVCLRAQPFAGGR